MDRRGPCRGRKVLGQRRPKSTGWAEGASGPEAGQEGRFAAAEVFGEEDRFADPEGLSGHTWHDLLTYWALVEADLSDRGIDLWSAESYRAYPWHKLRSRVEQLLAVPPTVTYRSDGRTVKAVIIPGTRIGLALQPPEEG